MLSYARGSTARAAAPKADGKSADFIFYAVDGPTGTVDPAFGAHVLPLKAWASAIWLGWCDRRLIADCFKLAYTHLGDRASTWWKRFSGTAVGVIATAWRISWSFTSPTTVRDDLGRGGTSQAVSTESKLPCDAGG